MRPSGSSWTRFVAGADGVTVDRWGPVFSSDRLVCRRAPLGPFAALKFHDEGGRCLATARHRPSIREEVVLRAEGSGGAQLLRIARDNPLIEVEPSFRITDAWSNSLLGRFEIRESFDGSRRRFWRIEDGQGEPIGSVDDPKSWPEPPFRIDFDPHGAVEVEPRFGIVRRAYSVRSSLKDLDSPRRVLAVAVTTLLLVIKKTGYRTVDAPSMPT